MTGCFYDMDDLPNLFGKWCRPNYNSAVAAFCHNMANDLPIQVNDRSTSLELLYIDDLVAEMMDALGYGLPIYHIGRKIEEVGTDFKDETYIIYVNSSCQDDTELGRLMKELPRVLSLAR